MADIYNRIEDYNRRIKDIKNWKLSTDNRKIIEGFIKAEIDRLSSTKKASELSIIKAIFQGTEKAASRTARPAIITKNLKDLSLQDFKELNTTLWQADLAPETHKSYCGIIKRIYYYAFIDSKDEEKLSIINRLQTRIKSYQLLKNKARNPYKTEDDIVTDDEAFLMLNVAQRPVEFGLIAVMFEGTKRPNEYLLIKIKDVNKTKEGFELAIKPSKGKHTKSDKSYLYVYNLKSYFAKFWNSHPYKDNPEAWLFYREDYGHEGENLGPAGATKIIRKLARKAGIKKSISLYHFRRGGYSWKRRSGMKDMIAGRDMEWAPGSSQAKYYEVLVENNVKEERKRLAGLPTEDKPMQEVKDKACPWCFFVNPPGNDVCENCGKELDLRKILDKQDKEREAFQQQVLEAMQLQFQKYVNDPKLLEAAVKEKKQRGKKNDGN